MIIPDPARKLPAFRVWAERVGARRDLIHVKGNEISLRAGGHFSPGKRVSFYPSSGDIIFGKRTGKSSERTGQNPCRADSARPRPTEAESEIRPAGAGRAGGATQGGDAGLDQQDRNRQDGSRQDGDGQNQQNQQNQNGGQGGGQQGGSDNSNRQRHQQEAERRAEGENREN